MGFNFETTTTRASVAETGRAREEIGLLLSRLRRKYRPKVFVLIWRWRRITLKIQVAQAQVEQDRRRAAERKAWSGGTDR